MTPESEKSPLRSRSVGIRKLRCVPGLAGSGASSEYRKIGVRASSERYPYRALHDAGLAGRDRLAEAGVHLVARRVEPGRVVDGGELDVVQHVVHLPTELQAALAVAADPEILEEREVPVVDRRVLVGIARRVAGVAFRGPGHRRRIQPGPVRPRGGVAV